MSVDFTREAFNRFLVENLPQACAFARYLLRHENDADADDVMQEAVIALYKSWTQSKPLDDPLAFFRKIIRNKAVNFRRSQEKQSGTLSISDIDSSNMQAPSIEDDGARLCQIVDEAAHLRQMLSGLHERYRQIFLLRHGDPSQDGHQLDFDAIAEQMGLKNRKHARTIYSRAVKNLRKLVEKQPGQDHE